MSAQHITGPRDAEFDFRYLPSLAPGSDLLATVAGHYQNESGRERDLDRVMAWHIRTVLGDALWRSEAGVALPGGGDPATWVDALATNARGWRRSSPALICRSDVGVLVVEERTDELCLRRLL